MFCALLANVRPLSVPGFYTLNHRRVREGGVDRATAMGAKLVNGEMEGDSERVFYQLMQYSWHLVKSRKNKRSLRKHHSQSETR